MEPRLPFLFSETHSNFIRYNRKNIVSAAFYSTYKKYYGEITFEEVERQACCIKLLELDKAYLKLLNEKELEIVNYLRRHQKGEKEWLFDRIIFNSAFMKWCDFYNKKQSVLFGGISSKALGKVMETIRVNYGFTQTSLADSFGVNRKTVQRIEKGEVMPSLEYTLRFAKFFNVTIDGLIKIAVR